MICMRCDGGRAAGVLADSLAKTAMNREHRNLVLDGRLVLVSPYDPGAGFNVGHAMQRNKLIYALADYAVVVSSELETGGTWRGATEALRAKWCPVFARTGHDTLPGNQEILKKGALAFPEFELKWIEDIAAWMKERSMEAGNQPEGTNASKDGEQWSLFD